MKEILVLYYSQSGQLRVITESLLSPLFNDENYNCTFKKIIPVKEYPFPWQSDAFFDVMPESVLGIKCDLELMDFKIKNYDLIILAYQVWYISPSIPVWSFLNDDRYKDLFKNTKVITLAGARNMWVMALRDIHKRLEVMEANHIGNIVFVDKHNNLVSVLTIIKWLFSGDKGPYRSLPGAGVSQKEIAEAGKFGLLIKKSFTINSFDNFQNQVIEYGGVPINFAIKTTEQSAKRIFKVWAKMILKKGSQGNPKRLFLVRTFKYYLLFLIFVISPFVSILFTVVYYLFYPITKRHLHRIATLKLSNCH